MFNASQITLARKRRGLTKRKLAMLVDVTDRTVTAWETGESEPTQQALARLEECLRFPRSFFYADDVDEISEQAASFRSLSKMTASQKHAALAAGSLAVSLNDWITARFDLPEPSVPRFPLGIEAEAAADVIRQEWSLGELPIPNMVHLLESHGVRIFSLADQTREVDAFSCWHRGVPFIFLNTMKSAEHSRQDAAHELGHLSLHWHTDISRGHQAEREAQQFGAALLMPRRTLSAVAPKLLSMDAIIALKRRWRVSATSLVYRLHALNLISDWHYRSTMIELSKRGYRREEHYGFPRESSQVLNKVLSALRRERIGKLEIANELRLHPDDLDALMFGLATIAAASAGTTADPATRPRPFSPRVVGDESA